MGNEINPRSIRPADDRAAIVESRLLTRGLDLSSKLEFTPIIPAAILVHNNKLMIVEDAAFRFDSYPPYLDNDQPRVFAIHEFTLNQHRYCNTTFYSLPTLDEEIVHREFVIREDHLVVVDTLTRLCERPWHRHDRQWVEYVFTLDGEFITALTDHPSLLAEYWTKKISAKAVKISDPHFRPFMGVASRRMAKLTEIDFNPFSANVDSTTIMARTESLPFIASRDVFRALNENPTTREITIPAIARAETELYRAVHLADLAFWEIRREGKISFSKGPLKLCANFADDLNVHETKAYIFNFHVEGDSEVLLGWAESSNFRDTNYLTYCWIENQRIRALHIQRPIEDFTSLNLEGYPKFRSSNIMVDSVLHHGLLYITIDIRFPTTSAIMMLDIRTSTVSSFLPKVPKGTSVLQRQS